MIRMFHNHPIETRELMTECGIHQGRWDNDGGFCVFDDGARFEMYLEHVAVKPEEVAVAQTEEGISVVNADIQRREAAERELEQLTNVAVRTRERDAMVRARAEAEEAWYNGQTQLAYTGLSPDAPTTENDNGGKQSVVEGRFDLIPPIAAFELAKVMEHGATKYAPKNWMKIDVDSHLNHLLAHVFAYMAGDRQDDHLTHALARAAMAVEIEKVGVAK